MNNTTDTQELGKESIGFFLISWFYMKTPSGITMQWARLVFKHFNSFENVITLKLCIFLSYFPGTFLVL